MEEKFKSIIYLEDRVKKQDNEISALKQEISNLIVGVQGKEEMIKLLKELLAKKEVSIN